MRSVSTVVHLPEATNDSLALIRATALAAEAYLGAHRQRGSAHVATARPT